MGSAGVLWLIPELIHLALLSRECEKLDVSRYNQTNFLKRLDDLLSKTVVTGSDEAVLNLVTVKLYEYESIPLTGANEGNHVRFAGPTATSHAIEMSHKPAHTATGQQLVWVIKLL